MFSCSMEFVLWQFIKLIAINRYPSSFETSSQTLTLYSSQLQVKCWHQVVMVGTDLDLVPILCNAVATVPCMARGNRAVVLPGISHGLSVSCHL